MSDSEERTSWTVVKTYVPAHQRDEWDDHADGLGMSRSEFVRTMVQAGRRGFQRVDPPGQGEKAADGEKEAAPAPDREVAVLEALSKDEYRSWEELLAVVTEDIEGQLEETLQELRDDGRIQHSPRNGGYTLVAGEP
jgi:hypothetical protein